MDGNVDTYLITGLSPLSEYEVLLAAIYGNEVESDEVVLVETTGTARSAWVLLHGDASHWIKCSSVCFDFS